MTRRNKWLLVGALVLLGCGGVAVARHVSERKANGLATDENGQALSCILDLTLGAEHTCVLFENGRVHCYGGSKSVGTDYILQAEKQFQETGHITAIPNKDPVKTEVRFSAIDAGHRETCGLSKADGGVWCWGEVPGWVFEQGEARYPVQYPGFGRDNIRIGVGGTRACVLKKDASVRCAQLSRPEGSEKVLDGVEKLHVRNSFACAKMKSGEVQCWGNNGNGQLGRGSISTANAGEWSEDPAPVLSSGVAFETVRLAAVAACGLTRAQGIHCWGHAGYSHFADGRIDEEGSPGQKLIETTPIKLDVNIPFRDLVLGTTTACILAEDRTVWCWGGAGWNDMLAEPSVVLKRENSIVSLEPRPRQLEPLGNDNARIWAGGAHYCVQKLDKSIWCWGNNRSRQVNREIYKYENEKIVGTTAPLMQLPVVCPEP